MYQRQPCQERFFCQNCGRVVSFTGAGTKHRNHCPHCLFSLHGDVLAGDRSANCSGLIKPISVWIRKNQEWAIIHRCRNCTHTNEPGCGIAAAIKAGQLSAQRWQAYQKLTGENDYFENKAAFLKKKKEKFYQIAWVNRNNKKQ